MSEKGNNEVSATWLCCKYNKLKQKYSCGDLLLYCYVMRTEPFQLPSYEELLSILKHEDTRTIPIEKERNHYAEFSTLCALLQEYDMPSKLFEETVKFEDLENPAFFAHITSLFSDLVKNILHTERQNLFDAVYDYLSEADTLQKADIIFVFGSKSTLRIERAVELYKQGYAPKIMISGKGPFYEQKETLSEAEKLGQYAIDHGVPQEALILEKESITIPDNVKRSLNLLEKKSIPHESIILVNSPFSQRRGWAHFSKMSEVGTTLIRVNARTVYRQFSKDGWYKDEVGVKVIVKEFFSLRFSELLNTS